jgi:hypothetical protein
LFRHAEWRKIRPTGMSDLHLPAPEEADSDEVAVALETARVELKRGDHASCEQWLRKASHAAERQGNRSRAQRIAQAAVEVGGPDSAPFEPLPGQEQVLTDIDDDFSDETIVDKAPKLPEAVNLPKPAPATTTIATPPTPIARPPRPSKGPSVHGAIRVSVRRALGGKLEARPLAENEAAPAGEEEALLVPLKPGVKLV